MIGLLVYQPIMLRKGEGVKGGRGEIAIDKPL